MLARFGDQSLTALTWAARQRKIVVKTCVASPRDRLVHWITVFGEQAAEIDDFVGELYAYLVSFTTDEANRIVGNAGEGNGLEAWRRLHSEYDPTSALVVPPLFQGAMVGLLMPRLICWTRRILSAWGSFLDQPPLSWGTLVVVVQPLRLICTVRRIQWVLSIWLTSKGIVLQRVTWEAASVWGDTGSTAFSLPGDSFIRGSRPYACAHSRLDNFGVGSGVGVGVGARAGVSCVCR